MPRPLRIEYPNAYYHVMNRGRGRQRIFHDDDYFKTFLAVLDQAHQRFAVQVLCYCLMSNHYHLLVKTPEGNLGRVMRHVNGVYTQRYNRLRNTDGPLFRGRYKAIVIEEDSYQLQVSRYIHRNPIEAGMVDRLEGYRWSSYPFYVNSQRTPDWLYQRDIYGQLGVKSHFRQRYRAFVELGVDEELASFYGKGNQMPYLGSEAFRDWVYQRRQTDDHAVSHAASKPFRPSLREIAQSIAHECGVDTRAISVNPRGRVEDNIPRWIFMYLAQELGGCTLREIADYLNLKRTGSIPTTIAKLQSRIANDKKIQASVRKIKRRYDT